MAVLERAAGDAGRGRVAHADVLAAFARATHAEALVPRAVPRTARGVAGFAIREGVETEQRMLALEVQGRGTVAPLYAREERTNAARLITSAELAAAEHGHS